MGQDCHLASGGGMNDNRPIWFDALLLAYEPFLRKRCIYMMPDSAEEAYQEATCRALENWHKFRTDGSFTAWLNFIVRTIRHESAKPVAVQTTPTTQPATQEFVAEAHDATRNLSPLNTKMVAMLTTGHTFVEVGKAQGVSSQAVAERARRVWKAMAANDNEAINAAA
jgi:DNA-directed RNA polymerase specialized sigma24 family protein